MHDRVTEPDPRRWKALAVLGVAYLMVVLDVSIVNVALPSIQKDLHFSSPENLQWVVSGYALTFGGLLLLGGRARRPPRPAAAVHGRARRFRGLLAALRALDLVGDADRVPRAPGRGRRDPLAVGVLDHDRHLRGGRGAEQGARHPRRDRRLGRRDRRSARRRPHRVRGLGVDLLRQRPDRPRRALPRAALRAREPRRGPGAHFDAAGAVAVTGEPDAARLRPDAGDDRRLGLGETIGVARRLGRS